MFLFPFSEFFVYDLRSFCEEEPTGCSKWLLGSLGHSFEVLIVLKFLRLYSSKTQRIFVEKSTRQLVWSRSLNISPSNQGIEHMQGDPYSCYLEVESQDCIIWSSWLHVLSIFVNSWFHPFKTPHGPLFVVKANHESGRMLTKMHSEHICVVVLVNRFDSILSWICTIL